MLADHNSLIVPTRDCSNPSVEKKNEFLSARDTEVAVIDQLRLFDSWVEVHADEQAHKHAPPKGYTYGYSVQNTAPKDDRILRRLDGIHVSGTLKGYIAKAFTKFLCNSNHKAVVVVPLYSPTLAV